MLFFNSKLKTGCADASPESGFGAIRVSLEYRVNPAFFTPALKMGGKGDTIFALGSGWTGWDVT
jgi:hypothetical protein